MSSKSVFFALLFLFSLGYNVVGQDSALTLKKEKYNINKINFYLTINNLYVWTKYSGVDPEVGYGAWASCYDNAKTPRSKDLTMGITIGL